MAVNLKKPAKATYSERWDFDRKIADGIIEAEGWIAYHILVNLMNDGDARKQARILLQARDDYFEGNSSDLFIDHFEQAIRETISGWFHGEINYGYHDGLLLSIVDNLLVDNDFIDLTETARALIYLLDYYAEPEEE